MFGCVGTGMITIWSSYGHIKQENAIFSIEKYEEIMEQANQSRRSRRPNEINHIGLTDLYKTL